MTDSKLIHDGEICKELLENDDFKEYQKMLLDIYEAERNKLCVVEKTVPLDDARMRGAIKNMKRVINLPEEKKRNGEIEKNRLKGKKPSSPQDVKTE